MSNYFISKDDNFKLILGDCFEEMKWMDDCSFDSIITDPPYFLSSGGITCQSGKMVSVNKGKWDEQISPHNIHEFNVGWIKQCQRLLKPNGTIWISGTQHNIHSIGFALQCLGFKILNDITQIKPNPPPNLACKCFTHATETIIWAAKSDSSKYTFHYADMKKLNGGKQMKSVWEIGAPKKEEKTHGKHPTQKPEMLLERIIQSSTNENDLILDSFAGSSTTGIVAIKLKRKYVGIDNDEKFLEISKKRFEEIV